MTTGPLPLDFATGMPPEARILVTGGSGFIGTNVVARYLEAGFSVVNADRSPPRNPAHWDLWRAADLTDRQGLEAVFDEVRPSHVFHLGARTDLLGGTLDDYAANVQGVSTFLDVLRAYGAVERLVVSSSRMVCRIGYRPTSDVDYCPSTPYGASKVETERLVRNASDLPWTMGRPTSIWGPWFDVPYRDFFLNVARGRYVHPRGREIPKHFGYVGNTVWQLHHLMTAPDDAVLHRLYYLADDPPIEVSEFARQISAEVGRRPPREVPMAVLTSMAKVGDALERTGRRAPLTSFRLANLTTAMLYDLEATMALTGPLPYQLETSVPETVGWMREANLI